MSLEEFSEQLGVAPGNLSTKPHPPIRKTKNKVLSFLSDSCYLSSPLWLSGSDSEPESDITEDEVVVGRPSGGFHGDGSNFLLVDSLSSGSLSAESAVWASPHVGGCGFERLRPHSPLSLSQHHLPTSIPHQTITMAMTSHARHPSVNSPSPTPSTVSEDLQERSHDHHMALPHPPSLTRHQSLVTCTSSPTPSLASSGKTHRAHVSCPDFHSCSTDMELGLVSRQHEDQEEMETDVSLERTSPGSSSHILVPESGKRRFQNLTGVKNLPSRTPYGPSTSSRVDKLSLDGGPTEQAGVKFSPAQGFEIQPNTAARFSKKIVPQLNRTPLQSVANTPRVWNHRLPDKREKPVVPTSTEPDKPAQY